jgi:DNA-directed RNA polymerase specialized sigma24 family protein
MAKNCCLNWRRDRNHESAVPNLEAFPMPDRQGLVRELEDRALDVLEAEVSSLPKQLGDLYQRRFVQRRSQIDTANELGLSRQQVRTLENRLKNRLSRAIIDAGVATDSLQHTPL